MSNGERYKIIRNTLCGKVNGWTLMDTEHPLISFPYFRLKREAEAHRARLYCLTLEEYERLHGQTGQKRQRIKNDNKPQKEE